MKGYITGVGSALLAWPLAENHPVLFLLVTVLLTVTILTFWTGLVRVDICGKKSDQ